MESNDFIELQSNSIPARVKVDSVNLLPDPCLSKKLYDYYTSDTDQI
jgi:hypothetical protein